MAQITNEQAINFVNTYLRRSAEDVRRLEKVQQVMADEWAEIASMFAEDDDTIVREGTSTLTALEVRELVGIFAALGSALRGDGIPLGFGDSSVTAAINKACVRPFRDGIAQ